MSESIPALLAKVPSGHISSTVPAEFTRLLAALDVNDRSLDAIIHAWIKKQLKDVPIVESDPANRYTHQYVTSWAARVMTLAARIDVAAIADTLWPYLGSDIGILREMTARALLRLGDSAVTNATELLADNNPLRREGAVTLLGINGSPTCLETLDKHVGREDDDNVRDALFAFLDPYWTSQGRTFGRKEIDARIQRASARLPIPLWIGEAKLPLLRDVHGRPFDVLATRYLFFRQSRVRPVPRDPDADLLSHFVVTRHNADLDIEARPLYRLIDRQSGGDFSLALLDQFIDLKQKSVNTYALSVIGALGDDRVVPKLYEQTTIWAERRWYQIAEHAARGLALVPGDAALIKLDALSRLYRTRSKNVSEAAAEAFTDLAARRGMSPEELGDFVVPTLGFTARTPRLVDGGKSQLEARIGLDFKLVYFDPVKKKKVAALPKSTAAEVAAEFKQLAVSLRETGKTQIARLESLLIRQNRWPAARWRELYQLHPLLIPFGVRLVWGVYDDTGTLRATFRALDDGGLTTADDAAFSFPESGTIGVLHPTELTEAERRAWLTHLADNEIEPPFPQMERHVFRPTAEQASKTRIDVGREMNAMTFKGRALRANWLRTGVGDSTMVPAYYKRFAHDGIDALLLVEGLYLFSGVESEVEVESLVFVRAGSIKFGGYSHDVPWKPDDPRLVPAGQVPPMAFSESMADVQKICGEPPAST